jgi:hypothetical protein
MESLRRQIDEATKATNELASYTNSKVTRLGPSKGPEVLVAPIVVEAVIRLWQARSDAEVKERQRISDELQYEKMKSFDQLD